MVVVISDESRVVSGLDAVRENIFLTDSLQAIRTPSSDHKLDSRSLY